MGQSSQGALLPNQVQAVRQGVGVLILPDGTINFDSTTATGVMRLNNPLAYNAYVWPALSAAPATDSILQSDGLGNILWTNNYVPATGPTGAAQLPVGTTANRPLPPAAGEIRYNSDTGALEYYDGANWVSVVAVGPTPGPTIGFGLGVSGTAIKVSTPTVSPSPAAGTLPAEAMDGSLYWDNVAGLLFIYYNDGTSSQWVQVTPSGGGGGTGTVTSVGITGTSGIGVVSGSPVTSAGSITLAIDIATLPVLP